MQVFPCLQCVFPCLHVFQCHVSLCGVAVFPCECFRVTHMCFHVSCMSMFPCHASMRDEAVSMRVFLCHPCVFPCLYMCVFPCRVSLHDEAAFPCECFHVSHVSVFPHVCVSMSCLHVFTCVFPCLHIGVFPCHVSMCVCFHVST